MVVSFGKYEISMMIPFVIFSLSMIVSAELPVGYLLKKMMMVAPFALFIGIFNPLMDREPLMQIGSLLISGGMGFKVFVSLLEQLLLRTLDRAQRIHLAMCYRGFDGHIRINRTMKFGYKEMRFILAWLLLFVFFRSYNLPANIGGIIAGCF